MRKKIAVVVLASGLAGGALFAPSLASAADTGSMTGVGGRVSAIKHALSGLVKDKTLTQAQADKVATTLDQKLPKRGPGGPGHRGGPRGDGRLGPAEVAKALGMSPQELRTQHQAGKTLTEIAKSKGINRAELIDRLVTAVQDRLAAEVKAGRLTQARADRISKDLKARITKRVDAVGHGPRGERDHDAPPPAGTAS